MRYRTISCMTAVILLATYIILTGCGAGQQLPESQRLAGESRMLKRSADTYFVRGMLDLALQRYLDVIEQMPYNIESLVRTGDIYLMYADQEPAKAQEFYEKAFHYFDRAILAYEEISEVGQFDALEDLIKDARLKRTGSWGRLFRMGQVLYTEEKYDEALQRFYEIAELTPDSTNTYIMIATIYQAKEQSEDAAQYFYKIASMNENDTASRNNLAIYYTNKQDYEEAVKWYKRLIEIEPENALHYFNKGEVYTFMEKHDDAIRVFVKAYEVDGSFIDALINAATIAFSQQKMDRAIELYKKAIEESPEEEYLYAILVVALNMQENYDDLLKYSLKWYELDETNIEAVEWIRVAAFRTGDDDILQKYNNIYIELKSQE